MFRAWRWGLRARLGLAAVSMLFTYAVTELLQLTAPEKRKFMIVIGAGNLLWLTVSVIELYILPRIGRKQ